MTQKTPTEITDETALDEAQGGVSREVTADDQTGVHGAGAGKATFPNLSIMKKADAAARGITEFKSKD